MSTTAKAIKILVYAARSLIHGTPGGNHVLKNLTDTCEFASFALLEMLNGQEIHDFQKYLILRYLFQEDNKLDYSLNSFSVKQVIFATSLHQNPLLPFKELFFDAINSIYKETEYYPLKTICRYIIEKQKNKLE